MRIPAILLAAAMTVAPAFSTAASPLAADVRAAASSTVSATPDGLVKAQLAAVIAGDIKALITCMPAEKLELAKAQWEAFQQSPEDPNAEMQFGMVKGMLMAPDAVKGLVAMALPQMAQAQQMMPMMLGMMGQGMQQAMQMQMGMTDPAEVEQAAKVVEGMMAWLGGVDLTDEAKLTAAITTVVDTFGKLKIGSVAEFKKLTFDEVLVKGGVAFIGLKKVLATYGFDIDAAMKSAVVGAPVIDGDNASVPVTMKLFDIDLTSNAKLIKVDGVWVSEQ